MPTIPIQKNLISEDVPGYQAVPEVGVANALANTGAQVERIGASLLTDVKQAQAQTESSTAYYQTVQNLQAKKAQLTLDSPDGFVKDGDGAPIINPDGSKKTISQEFSDYANKQFDTGYTGLSTSMAQNQYESRTREHYNVELTHLKGIQLEKNIQFTNLQFDEHVRDAQSVLSSTPDVADAYQYSNDLGQDVMDSHLYPLPQKLERVTKQNQMLSRDLIEGATNQILSNVREGTPGYARQAAINDWRAVVNGDPELGMSSANLAEFNRRTAAGLPTIDQMLSPEEKVRLDKQLIHLTEAAKAMDMSDREQNIKNLKAGLANGTLDPDQALGALDSFNRNEDKLVAVGALTTSKKAETQADIHASAIVGQTFNSPGTYLSVTDDELIAQAQDMGRRAKEAAQINNSSSNPLSAASGLALEQSTKTEAVKKATEIVDSRKKNFPDYLAGNIGNTHTPILASAAKAKLVDITNATAVTNNAQVLRQFYNEKNTTYDQLYPGQPQYNKTLFPEQSALLKKYLSDPKTKPEQAATLINSISKAYPISGVIDQMIQDDGLSEKFRIVPYTSQTLSRADLLESAMGFTQQKMANYEQSFGKGSSEELKQAVLEDKGTQIFIRTMAQSHPNSPSASLNASSYREAIAEKAARYRMQNMGISASEAVSASSQALVGRNEQYVESNSKGWLDSVGLGSAQTGKVHVPLYRQDGTPFLSEPQQAYLHSVQDSDSLKKLGMTPPPGISEDVFWSNTPTKGYWMLDPKTHDSWYFMYRLDSPNGPAREVGATRNGKPELFSISVDEATKRGILMKNKVGPIQKFMGTLKNKMTQIDQEVPGNVQ